MQKLFIDELRAAHPLYMDSAYCESYKSRHDDCFECESYIGCLKYFVLIKAYRYFTRRAPARPQMSPLIARRLSALIVNAQERQVLELEKWLDKGGEKDEHD